jgi:hypothetical protein
MSAAAAMPAQTPHNGDRSRGSGAVIWCVHRDASCRRLPGHEGIEALSPPQRVTVIAATGQSLMPRPRTLR